MKKLCFLFFASSIVLVGYSCKKKKNQDEPVVEVPVAVLKPFGIKLDQVDYSGTTPQTTHVSGYIGIQSTVADTLKFGISIADSLTPGTYAINNSSPFRVTHSDDNFVTMYYSTTGSVKIITHDKVAKKISGTYSCNLNRINPASMKTINTAEFNVSY